MNPLKLTLLMLVGTSINLIAQTTNCEDPNFNDVQLTLETCNLSLDLCLDRFVLSNNSDAVKLNVFSNDIGSFDPCMSSIVEMPGYPKFGQAMQLPDTDNPACAAIYMPNNDAPESFLDTFFYAITLMDVCENTAEYCADGSGKIWNFWSQYEGEKEVSSIVVSSKQGSKFIPFQTINGPVNQGDYFFADGMDLPNSQANWNFTFHFSDETETTVPVHTSCSAPIFGLTHPAIVQGGEWISDPNEEQLMTPTTGYLAAPNNKENGVTISGTSLVENPVASISNTFSLTEITMVIVQVNSSILPIEISAFYAENNTEAIDVSWNVESVIGEEYMVLERSYDAENFEPLETFNSLSKGIYSYEDTNPVDAIHYYRLAIYNFDGDVTYSNVISNEWNSGKVGFSVFPNPASDLINIDVNNFYSSTHTGIKDIRIYDLVGKVKASIIPQSPRTVLNKNDFSLETGIYVVEVRQENGKSTTQKLLIN